MAADRPRKRTPKVAGRNSPRVGGNRAEESRSPSAVGSASSTAGEVGVSGVERKRLRADAEREAKQRELEATDVDPRVNDASGTFRRAAILAAIAVVIGAVAAILAFHPGAKVTENKAFVDRGATDQVMAKVRESACAPLQYDYRKLDDWITSYRGTLTGSALSQMEEFAKATRSIIEQSKAATNCRVETVGLVELREDSAVLLANVLLDITQDGAAVEGQLHRLHYGLVKNDGRWLIDSVSLF